MAASPRLSPSGRGRVRAAAWGRAILSLVSARRFVDRVAVLKEYNVLDIAVFERDAEMFCRGREHARYLHYAGFQATLDLERLFTDYEYLFHPDAYGELIEAQLEPRPKRYLLDFVATGYLQSKTRVLDERVAQAEAATRVVWDDRELPYRMVPLYL